MSIIPLSTNVQHQRAGRDIEFDLDSDGLPIMPKWLEEYANHLLYKNGEETQELAEQVYDIWRQNDFLHVQTVPKGSVQRPRCQSEQSFYFDADEPEVNDFIEDYGDPEKDEEHPDNEDAMKRYNYAESLHEIHKAYAKSHCAVCPLKATCLADSLTQDLRDRSGNIIHTSVGFVDNGIYGGWGPGARRLIRKKMIDIWNHPSNEWDYNSDYLRQLAEEGVEVPEELLG